MAVRSHGARRVGLADRESVGLQPCSEYRIVVADTTIALIHGFRNRGKLNIEGMTLCVWRH